MYAHATATAGHTGSQLGSAFTVFTSMWSGHRPGPRQIRRSGEMGLTPLPAQPSDCHLCGNSVTPSAVHHHLKEIITSAMPGFGSLHHGDLLNGGNLPPAAPSADAGEAKQKIKRTTSSGGLSSRSTSSKNGRRRRAVAIPGRL